MARPLKPFVRSGGYYPSAKYTPLVYPGGYTTLNAKNGKPEPINTFLGKIVRFLAKRSLPMVKLEAAFTPIQDLNGQEAPYPPGGGKNKYSTTAGEDAWTNNGGGSHSNNDGELVITCSTLATSGVYGNGIQRSLVNNQSIAKTVSFDVKGSVSATIKVQAQSVEITTQYQRKSITIAANTAASLSIYGGGTANTIYIKNLAITGDGSTDYAPYSNICPISGHSGCEVVRTGKNLLNTHLYSGGTYNVNIGTQFTFTESAKQFTDEGNGVFSLNTTATWEGYTMLVPVPKASYLKFKAVLNSTGQQGFSVYLLNGDYVVLKKTIGNSVPVTAEWTINLTNYSEAKYFAFFITNRATASAKLTVTEPQLEIGSTASDYEPFSGTTVAISFGTTVYGCKLTVFEDGSGQVVATHSIATVDGTNIKAAGVYSNNLAYTDEISGIYDDSSYERQREILVLCDKLKACAYINRAATLYGICQNGGKRLILNIPGYTTKAEYNTWLQANNLNVIYELATPITIPVTAQQIQTLVGTNTVWVNAATGDITVQAYGTEIV